MAVVRHGAMDFDQQWDIQGVLDFISRRKSKTIAVQFPDDLLGQAVEVVQHLQQQCIARQLKATVCRFSSMTIVHMRTELYKFRFLIGC